MQNLWKLKFYGFIYPIYRSVSASSHYFLCHQYVSTHHFISPTLHHTYKQLLHQNSRFCLSSLSVLVFDPKQVFHDQHHELRSKHNCYPLPLPLCSTNRSNAGEDFFFNFRFCFLFTFYKYISNTATPPSSPPIPS